jgi:hypothetical protein
MQRSTLVYGAWFCMVHCPLYAPVIWISIILGFVLDLASDLRAIHLAAPVAVINKGCR